MGGGGGSRDGGIRRAKRPLKSSGGDEEAREEGLEGLDEGLEGMEEGLEGGLEEDLVVGDPGGYGEWWGLVDWLGEGRQEGLEGLEEGLEEGLHGILDRFEAVQEGALELEEWGEMLEGLGGVARVGHRWGLWWGGYGLEGG